jgi:L-asparagine oxygenase
MKENHEYMIVLTDKEKKHMQEIAESLPQTNIASLDDELLTKVVLESRFLPLSLAKSLIHFRKFSNYYGTLLIRNLPIDAPLPPTPADGRIIADRPIMISEYILLLIMLHLGEPIAYQDEKEGALIQNICPVKGQESRQENTGSVFLEFHTEDGFHPFKPDFVGLLCLRPDHGRVAKTATASINAVLSLLSPLTIDLLRQHIYRIRIASSFMEEHNEVFYSPLLPVLSGSSLKPEICVDFHAMESMDATGSLALKELKSTLEQKVVEVALALGDLMVVDNRVAAHARTGFQPRYDGHDRWLKRLFVVQDFRRSQIARPGASHVCYPLEAISKGEEK